MAILTEQPLLEPLLRLMGLPPSLVRYAPESLKKPLRTVMLRDTPMAKGVNASFDDTCHVTFVDGEMERLTNVKIALPGGKQQYSQIHLAILSTAGQIIVLLGGDKQSLFVGSGCGVRANFHLASQPVVFIGDGTTIAPSKFFVSNAELTIGSDCQIQEDVLVECNHQHQLHDLAEGEPMHPLRSVVNIGRHVWIGRRAMLLPGVKVGEGAVIQAGSVVSDRVAANTLVGGAPATCLREQVAWTRQYGKSPEPAAASKA
jgi:acetyltransferase-like isoleucine patch superfamily enzyme